MESEAYHEQMGPIPSSNESLNTALSNAHIQSPWWRTFQTVNAPELASTIDRVITPLKSRRTAYPNHRDVPSNFEKRIDLFPKASWGIRISLHSYLHRVVRLQTCELVLITDGFLQGMITQLMLLLWLTGWVMVRVLCSAWSYISQV